MTGTSRSRASIEIANTLRFADFASRLNRN
jgi:hypothetical protein